MTDNEKAPVGEPVEDKLVDEVVERLMDRADASGAALLGEGGLLTEVTRAVLERALDVEMTEHLGYEKHDPAGRGSGNSRNGASSKTVLTDAGAVTVAVPRTATAPSSRSSCPSTHGGWQASTSRSCPCTPAACRCGTSAPPGRHVRHRGLTRPDQQGHDAVTDELTSWQRPPVDAVWPIIYIDALWIKIRSGSVASKPVYLASASTWTAAKTCSACGWATRAKARRLDDGAVRTAQPRSGGRVYRRLRRAEGPAGCGHRDLAQGHRPDMRDPLDPRVAAACLQAPPSRAGHLAESDLTAPTEQAAEQALQEFAASELGQRYPRSCAHGKPWSEFTPYLAFRPRREGRLLDEPDRVDQRTASQDHPQPRAFPLRAGRAEVLYLAVRELINPKARDVNHVAAHWKKALNQFSLFFEDRLNAM